MKQSLLITHYYHSGFSVAWNDVLLVFDYWRGEKGELSDETGLTEDKLKSCREVYVFISHDHIDHLDPIVFTWREYTKVSYIVSSDMPVGTRGKRMAPGDTLEINDSITVTAFDSTDLGVSFLVRLGDISIFHAGDLNFWHWREESTMQEIDEADEAFRKAVAPISREKIDLAFFPVDPRQGTLFEAGANYFILTVKPRILIPMHYFHRADVAMEYARTASCRSTEVIAMPGYGDHLLLEEDEEGYLNLSFPKDEEMKEETEEAGQEPLLEENNPFLESDLPLSQLAEDGNNAQ